MATRNDGDAISLVFNGLSKVGCCTKRVACVHERPFRGDGVLPPKRVCRDGLLAMTLATVYLVILSSGLMR